MRNVASLISIVLIQITNIRENKFEKVDKCKFLRAIIIKISYGVIKYNDLLIKSPNLSVIYFLALFDILCTTLGSHAFHHTELLSQNSKQNDTYRGESKHY